MEEGQAPSPGKQEAITPYNEAAPYGSKLVHSCRVISRNEKVALLITGL
jgi:hypothetical protein